MAGRRLVDSADAEHMHDGPRKRLPALSKPTVMITHVFFL